MSKFVGLCSLASDILTRSMPDKYKRFVKVGLGLFLGGIVFTVFIMAGGSFSALPLAVAYVVVLIPLLAALSGFILICVGAFAFAVRLSSRRLTALALASAGLATICYLGFEKLRLGFDDPSILLGMIPFVFFLLALLFLVCAGVRQFRTKTPHLR